MEINRVKHCLHIHGGYFIDYLTIIVRMRNNALALELRHFY